MALSYKFFRIAFAATGDVAAVPDGTQGDGSVSYNQGFGPDYQADPGTDPDAKDVPRDQTNQLYNDITKAVQWFQTMGIPQFIAAADNGGSAYSYAKNAVVVWTDDNVYQSIVATNTALPSDTTKWRRIDYAAFVSYVQNQAGNFAAATMGGANAYAATYDPPVSAHQIGVPLRFTVPTATVVGTATFNPGPGIKDLYRGYSPLFMTGDLTTNAPYTAIYDGTRYRVVELYAASALGFGSIPDTLVPSTNTFTEILDLTDITSSGRAVLLIQASGPGSRSWGGMILAAQFASGTGAGNTPPWGVTVQNVPGTVTFQVVAQSVQMAITGAVGNYTVSVKVIAL